MATFTAHFASGAVGTFSISRVAPGHANSLAFDLFAENGAAKWDMDRPAEFSVIRQLRDDGLDGYNQVLVGPAHPYLKGGVPMDFPGVSFGVGDLFGFQTRAFLEQVAGIEGGLPPVASFADGVRDLTVIDAVIRSAAAGGAVVDLPPTTRDGCRLARHPHHPAPPRPLSTPLDPRSKEHPCTSASTTPASATSRSARPSTSSPASA